MSHLKLLNTLVIPLRWMDLDAYGHVGNSRFFDFMTDARVDLMGAEHVFADLNIQYVVVDAQCSFKKPTHYPGNLIVKQFCETIGNTSFTLLYHFAMEGDPETICVQGRLVMVCYNAKENKATCLPELVRNILQ